MAYEVTLIRDDRVETVETVKALKYKTEGDFVTFHNPGAPPVISFKTDAVKSIRRIPETQS